MERVKAAGGRIEGSRLNGRLAITRALGDFSYKRVEDRSSGQVMQFNYLISTPDVRMIEFDPFIDDFIVMASDGLFDKFSS